MLASPVAADAFERSVGIEEELQALLGDRLTQDQEMLGEMRRVA